MVTIKPAAGWEKFIRDTQRVNRKVDTMNGDGVLNTPDHITISQTPAARGPRAGTAPAPSRGQYPFMHYMTGINNAVIWDFPVAHAEL